LAGKDMFKKFPRQMLRSRTVSEGVRTVWPLATSGMYVGEEVADFTGPTIDAEPPRSERDAINESVPLRSAATAMPRGATRSAPVARTTAEASWLDPLEEPDPVQWMKNLDALLDNAQSRLEVEDIGGHHSVGTAIAKAPPAVRARVSEKLATAFGRFVDPSTTDAAVPELADVEIGGADKVMAG